MIKPNASDCALLGYIIDRIQGCSGPTASDRTIFLIEGGVVHSTIPASPSAFRGNKSFRQLRPLFPSKDFTGQMVAHRQGGEIKHVTFQ